VKLLAKRDRIPRKSAEQHEKLKCSFNKMIICSLTEMGYI